MIKFNKKIIQFGFGAIGKSFYELVRNEIKFDEYNYFVISRDKEEFKSFINMGGISTNFKVHDINKENFQSIFNEYLEEGDLLIDFADTVGTTDITKYCIEKQIMYINTGEADWPDNWYNIFDEYEKKIKLKEQFIKYPIVLQHGNNPGLVSHFTKSAINYIVKKQLKNKELKQLLKENKFNEVAYKIGLKTIHVNDIDLQTKKEEIKPNTLSNTWCIDSFFFEMLSESTYNLGTHEVINNKNNYSILNEDKGYIQLKELAINKKLKTYYPNGVFEGHLVPHEETITISKNLEYKNNQITYRPTVMFLYSPPISSLEYFKLNKVYEYKNQPDTNTIIRGYKYPENFEILYKENIKEGTEYVGVLLLGDSFNPVWVGNRIESKFLYKKTNSYWQSPTITPVAASALSAISWMIKNKDKGNIYFPDNIPNYQDIIKQTEKYISKTIYKTFAKEEL